MIKAIIFDYFGVISSDEYWDFVKQDRQTDSVFRDLTDDVNVGKIHWQSFVKKVAEKTGSGEAAVKTMYESEHINPRMVKIIEDLRPKYKMALLTNAHHEFMDSLLAKSGLEELFDGIVISSRLGMIKPDPRIFDYTLKELGVNPDEAIYIDDMKRHIDVARDMGIKTILYENFAQMKEELDELLND